MGLWILFVTFLFLSVSADISPLPRTIESATTTPITFQGATEGDLIFLTRSNDCLEATADQSITIDSNLTIITPPLDQGTYYVCLDNVSVSDALFERLEAFIQVVDNFNDVVRNLNLNPPIVCANTIVSIIVYGAFPGDHVYLTNNGACPEDAAGLEFLFTLEAESTFSLSTDELERGEYQLCWSAATDEDLRSFYLQDEILYVAPPISAIETITPPSCSASLDGIISVDVAGTPYTNLQYLWEPDVTGGESVNTATNLGAGVYNVLVTELHCHSSSWINIELIAPPELNASANSVPGGCFGGNQIKLEVAGGKPHYTFTIFNKMTGATIVQEGLDEGVSVVGGIPAGVYNATVHDLNSCKFEIPEIIVNPGAGLELSTTYDNVTCFGKRNGNVSVVPSGGIGVYNYSWTGPEFENLNASETLNFVPGGTYSVIVTDSEGCNATRAVIVSEPDELNATVVSTPPHACAGANEVTLYGLGGTPPYTFEIHPTNNLTHTDFQKFVLTDLEPGIYTATVRDANGCEFYVNNITIEPYYGLEVLNGSITNVSCYGGSNGGASVVVTGGSVPYHFEWTGPKTGPFNETASDLIAGTYNVTVTDADGCSKYLIITIPQPPKGLIFADINSQDIKCHGDASGEIMVAVSGGVPPYNIVWEGLTFANQSSFENSTVASNLLAGEYNITVHDGHFCNISTVVQISQPKALNVTIKKEQHGCLGEIVLLVAEGGSGPYAFTVFNGVNSMTDVGLWQISLHSLPPGNYSATVMDLNNCTFELENVIIEQTEGISLSILSSQNATCYDANDGFLNVSVAGTKGNYIIEWTTEEGQLVNFTESGNTTMAADLKYGKYNITVTDSQNCAASLITLIYQPEQMDYSFENSPALCHGLPGGSVTLQAIGGVGPYEFTWDSINSHNVTHTDNTSTAHDILHGYYNVTIVDSNMCTLEIINLEIMELPVALTVTIDEISHIFCYGDAAGSITASAIGGTWPYDFTWISIDGSEVNKTDLNDAKNSSTALALTPGNYSVIVRDLHGCVVEENDILITQPSAPLSYTIEIPPINCDGENFGSATVYVSGGTAPYYYHWSDEGINADDGPNSTVARNVPFGLYLVEILDGNSCTLETEVFNIGAAVPPTVQVEISPTTMCLGAPNGKIFVNASGGIGPYEFTWSSASGNFNFSNNTSSNTSLAYNMPSGNYSVTVKDISGCTVQKDIFVPAPKGISVSLINTFSAPCHGGYGGGVVVGVSGENKPYTYNWFSDDSAIEIDYADWGNMVIAQNLTAGIYGVRVEDGGGCTAELKNITVSQPPMISVSVSSTDVQCFQGSDGTVLVTASGGAGRYSFDLVGPTGDIETEDTQFSASAAGLMSGTYTIKVVDVNGCKAHVDDVIIHEPQELRIRMVNVTTDADWSGGSITIEPFGGTPPYTIHWTPINESSLTVVKLRAGTYNVTVADLHGCIAHLHDIIVPGVPPPNPPDNEKDDSEARREAAVIAMAVIFSVVGAVLLAVAVYFGVKKYRKRNEVKPIPLKEYQYDDSPYHR